MVVENPVDTLKNQTKTERELTHSSFWDRIKFLVSENGIQRYVVQSLIDPRSILKNTRSTLKTYYILNIT